MATLRSVLVPLFSGMVLTTAIGWQFASVSSEEAARYSAQDRPLAALLPEPDGMWRVEKLQLGKDANETESALRALQCDSYIHSRYINGNTWFSVYVAYWTPGKMPVYYVARKTPDACWPRSGMECTGAEFRLRIDCGDVRLKPAEMRVFSQPQGNGSGDIHVLFWLLVDGESFDYGQKFDATFDPIRWWREMIKEYTSGGKPNLYFVRIIANEPLPQMISREEMLKQVVRGLASIGLAESNN
jgi:hypothetical protein